MNRSVFTLAVFIFGFTFAFVGTTSAIEYAFGLRGGFTSDPDQFIGGGHIRIMDLIDDQFVLEPAVVAGFGDDITTFRASVFASYRFDVGTDFLIYPIAGISLWHYDFDESFDGDGNEVGLDLGGGIEYNNFALELTLGLGDIPDFMIVASYTFGI
ncbi:hypothetical protein JXA40_12755 [bacterium]|nr:hypothetical protein [candidate division CSSED10-310 bacterium]